MKILHIGTICNREHYEELIKKCSRPPTIAPLLYETALLKGIYSYIGYDLTVLSMPVVQVFPRGKILGWGETKELVEEQIPCTWLPSVNLPLVREMTQSFFAKKYIRQWIKANQGDELVILSYGVNAAAKNIQKICRETGVKCICIVADLPKHSYFAGRKLSTLQMLFAKLYTNAELKVQSGFDGYVYLTEAMCAEVAPGKPYCIVEGIADISDQNALRCERASKPAIMYAGTLAERYGIKLLVDSYNCCQGDYELWICGSGDYEDAVAAMAKENPNIKFFGRLAHEKTIELEQKAHLLVNIRSVTDEYTKYSFPSKNMEYLLSGTPVATTRLEGIPEEYFEHMYTISGQTPTEIAREIDSIMADENRFTKAEAAREFVVNYKSGQYQAVKVLSLAKRLISQ